MKTEQTNLKLLRHSYTQTMYIDIGNKRCGIREVLLYHHDTGPFFVCNPEWPTTKDSYRNNPFKAIDFSVPVVLKKKPDWALPAFIMLAKHKYFSMLEEDRYVLFLCPEEIGMIRTQEVSGDSVYEYYEFPQKDGQIVQFGSPVVYFKRELDKGRRDIDDLLKKASGSTWNMLSPELRNLPDSLTRALANYDGLAAGLENAKITAKRQIENGEFWVYDERIQTRLEEIMKPYEKTIKGGI